MKHLKILTLLLCSSLLIVTACKDDKTEATTEAKEDVRQPLQIFDAPAQQNTTAQNTSGLYHYTCPNGCAGGAAAAGNCSSCGNALAHNQAFHNTNKTPNTTPITTPTQTQTKAPEPSQNAAGIWHYTCSNGCAGGGGSAVNCSNCGNKLAHNSAYHN